MSFTIDINFNVRNSPVEQQLEALMAQIDQFRAKLDEIVAKVTEQSTQLDSLNVFVEGLQEAIRQEQLTPQDQAKVDAVFATLRANDQKIADAFTENTPPNVAPRDSQA